MKIKMGRRYCNTIEEVLVQLEQTRIAVMQDPRDKKYYRIFVMGDDIPEQAFARALKLNKEAADGLQFNRSLDVRGAKVSKFLL